MDNVLEIKYDGKPCYKIALEHDYSRLSEYVDDIEKKYGRICIVSDTNVAPLYLEQVREALAHNVSEITDFVFTAGEASKNLNVVEDLYEFLVRSHLDRHDLLVALGGGVVGDLCGFAAATYLRGIDFIQMPTSLLSMVDSSIGGKTGVDFRAFKNMVGAFYMPRLVYMNLSVLRSLPPEQFASGMGEVIKHGLIADKDYLDFLIKDREKISAFDPDSILHVVKRSCEIKGHVVVGATLALTLSLLYTVPPKSSTRTVSLPSSFLSLSDTSHTSNRPSLMTAEGRTSLNASRI